MIEVTLELPHTHKNTPCKKGDIIRVRPDQKQWLQRRGIIKTDKTNKTGEH